jgi:hypothetical protein
MDSQDKKVLLEEMDFQVCQVQKVIEVSLAYKVYQA